MSSQLPDAAPDGSASAPSEMSALPTPAVPPKPRHHVRTAAIAGAFLVFTVLACTPAIGGVDVDLGAFVEHWRNGWNKFVQLLQPNLAFLPRTVGPMLETLQMAVVGACAAALVSVPLTLWAAKPTNPSWPLRTIVRTIINVIRSVPDLVYASILVVMVGTGALPGVLTLFLFDIGIVVKLVSEAIDSSEHGYMEAGRAAGGSQLQINRLTALPQVMPLFANQWLYVLELNVRISAILGLVGAGGIGRLIEERRSFFRYDDVSAVIIEILVVVIIIEVISNLLRRRLV